MSEMCQQCRCCGFKNGQCDSVGLSEGHCQRVRDQALLNDTELLDRIFARWRDLGTGRGYNEGCAEIIEEASASLELRSELNR